MVARTVRAVTRAHHRITQRKPPPDTERTHGRHLQNRFHLHHARRLARHSGGGGAQAARTSRAALFRHRFSGARRGRIFLRKDRGFIAPAHHRRQLCAVGLRCGLEPAHARAEGAVARRSPRPRIRVAADPVRRRVSAQPVARGVLDQPLRCGTQCRSQAETAATCAAQRTADPGHAHQQSPGGDPCVHRPSSERDPQTPDRRGMGRERQDPVHVYRTRP
jgi:hypothetical protein